MDADDYEMIAHLQTIYRQEARIATEAVQRLNARRKQRP